MATQEDVEMIRTLARAVLGMCAIMRTHPDLTSTQHLDLGLIHGQLIKVTARLILDPPPDDPL